MLTLSRLPLQYFPYVSPRVWLLGGILSLIIEYIFMNYDLLYIKQIMQETMTLGVKFAHRIGSRESYDFGVKA